MTDEVSLFPYQKMSVLLKFHPVQALTACMNAYATCKQAIHEHDQHCLLEL